MHSRNRMNAICRMVVVVLAGLFLLGASSCNDGPPTRNGETPNWPKEKVIAKLNANNSQITSIFCYNAVTITNERFPRGQSGHAYIVYKRPDKLLLIFYVAGQRVFLMKTDGENVDIADFEERKGRTATVANLERFNALAGFQPDFLTAAMGLEIIEPSAATVETGEHQYNLTIGEPNGKTRVLHVTHSPFQLDRQDVYTGVPGASDLEMTVEYKQYHEVETTDTKKMVKIPTHMVIDVPGNNFKLEMEVTSGSIKDIRVNDERRVDAMTGGSWRYSWGPDMLVEELNDNGEWVPYNPEGDSH
ncbi:MAG: hypothetical protein ABIH04_01595 [Planctomycetota bacterium]